MTGGLVSYGIGRVESIAPWKVSKGTYTDSTARCRLTGFTGSLSCIRSSHSLVVHRGLLLPPGYPNEC